MTINKLRQVLLEEARREPFEMDIRRIQDALDDYRIDNVILANDEDKVLEFIERRFGVSNCLKNKTRIRTYTFARFTFWWYLRVVKGYTLQQIGIDCGYNHATVLNGLNQIKHLHKTNEFYEDICQIKNRLS